MFLKENQFDQHFMKANAETALQIAIFKAIAAAESEFINDFKTYDEPRKYGLMGITEFAISSLRKVSEKDFGEIKPSDLLDPEINIRMGAKLCRWLYHIIPPSEDGQYGGPNLMEVFAEWGKLNASGWDFPRKAWNAYWHYSQKPGEPHSILPAEMDGVDVRRPERQDVYR